MEIRENLSTKRTRVTPEKALMIGGSILAIAVGAVSFLKGSSEASDAHSALATESPYCITSHPAKVGEGVDDLKLSVFPHANKLPEGVIKVDQLGKDDLILGENEQARFCAPDNKSFRIARGLEAN